MTTCPPSPPDERARTVVETAPPTAHRGLLIALTLALFAVWCNTWLVFEVLLAPKTGEAPMRWSELLVARFSLVTPVCAVIAFGVFRRESLAIVRAHPVRLLLCGLV